MNQNENTHVQHARNQFISYYSETTSNGQMVSVEEGGGLRGASGTHHSTGNRR